ncbi:chemokine-like receptor 1 [Mauremys mutica]|uniref:chemokine-like receptor 1 n=1 Tax=Mauremys mutica TaxID=74926 RepID=UPI001D16D0FE|nr:chemokine-like receptor 1 [Mauremys mutica]
MEFLPVLFLVLCAMVFLAGVPLNGYVVFVAGCRLERTVSAVWFWSRAVTDFIFIVFLPIRIISIFVFKIYSIWRLSSTVISFHMFSSTFLLTVLSIDRCILVARPEWARNHRTPCLAFMIALVILALSVGFSLRYGDLSDYLLSPPSISMNFHPDAGRMSAAAVIQILVGFLIPLALILIPILYIVLAAKLRRNSLIQSTNPLKILLGLIPTFFLCWLPYHIFAFLQISDMYRMPLLYIGSAVGCVLTYFSSCLNPIFYLTMEEEFLKYQQRTRNPETTNKLGPELDE